MEESILECIITLKKLLQPRGYASAEDLKKLICDWIDRELTNGL